MRSRIHMLTVAAARIEEAHHGNPKLVADLRAAAKAEATALAEGRCLDLEVEEKRIGRQRTLMAMVPDTRAKDDLITAMIQRAYDLMWDGGPMECDVLVEFLPSALVEKMFAAWMEDATGDNDKPKSDFYERKFRA